MVYQFPELRRGKEATTRVKRTALFSNVGYPTMRTPIRKVSFSVELTIGEYGVLTCHCR